jgi:hypothetical protein
VVARRPLSGHRHYLHTTDRRLLPSLGGEAGEARASGLPMTSVLIALCLASLIFGCLAGFSYGLHRHDRSADYFKAAFADAAKCRDDYHQQLVAIALGIGLTETEDSDVCVLLAINRLNKRVAVAEAERDGALDTLAFIDRTYADEHDDNLTDDAKDVKARARVVRRIEEAEKASEQRRQEVVHLQRVLATRNGQVAKLREVAQLARGVLTMNGYGPQCVVMVEIAAALASAEAVPA